MNANTATILSNDTCTPQEIRRVLRSGKSAVYDAIKSGEIPSFRIGGTIKIPTSWLAAKLQAE